MADFSSVPVVDVTNRNFNEVWPSLLLAVKRATFIAFDLELSGLGDRFKLNARHVEERYTNMIHTARTRSVLSFGIACFNSLSPADEVIGIYQRAQQTGTNTTIAATRGTELQENAAVDSQAPEKACDLTDKNTSSALKMLVQTFNIMVLCEDDYVVEPRSLLFLVNHGFDFNKQYSSGISYYRGNDKENEDVNVPSLRNLVAAIVKHKKPLVVHNGLIDVMFLYENFYAELPPKLSTFVSDLMEVFAGGIYDTKYISEISSIRWSASYLEYVYRKSQKQNMKEYLAGRPHIELRFVKYPASCSYVEERECSLSTSSTAHLKPCHHFGLHGWCANGTDCTLSHDIDDILNMEDKVQVSKQRRRNTNRKRKKAVDAAASATGVDIPSAGGKSPRQLTVQGKQQLQQRDIVLVNKKSEETKNTKILDFCEKVSKTFIRGKTSEQPSMDQIPDSIATNGGNVVPVFCRRRKKEGRKDDNLVTAKQSVINMPAAFTGDSQRDDITEKSPEKLNSLPVESCNSAVSCSEETSVARSVEVKDTPRQDESVCDGTNGQCYADIADSVKRHQHGTDITPAAASNGEINGVVDYGTAVKCQEMTYKNPSRNKHRAGFDAFMTGFSFAHHLCSSPRSDISSSLKDAAADVLDVFSLDQIKNKICLCGKSIPLHIVQMNFAKPSKNHRDKYEKLNKC